MRAWRLRRFQRDFLVLMGGDGKNRIADDRMAMNDRIDFNDTIEFPTIIRIRLLVILFQMIGLDCK